MRRGRLYEKRSFPIKSGAAVQYAHGMADFIAKLQIALKEANETGYWLELLYKTGYLTEENFKALDSACASIRVLLISSLNTAKKRAEKNGKAPQPL